MMKVHKTIKLFIGGKFPRTESGRTYPQNKANGELYAHLCLASRKDFRNAVEAALGAGSGWAKASAFNRSQILYRMAEMTEGKRQEFVQLFSEVLGVENKKAHEMVDGGVDAFVYYAGFADKYQQVLGSVNPVSGPHHNFTATEAVGVVGLVCDKKFNFGLFISQLAAIISSGNSLIALISFEGSAMLAPIAEILATSDLPKGVINLLTGDIEELYPHFATHMEIQSLSCQTSDKKILTEFKLASASNMKRIVPPIKKPLSLEHLMSFVEFKTVWHPIGN